MANVYLKGSSKLKLDPHMNLVTAKKEVVDLSRFGFRAKPSLKQGGALNKYFDGSYFEQNPSQQSKACVDEFLYE